CSGRACRRWDAPPVEPASPSWRSRPKHRVRHIVARWFWSNGFTRKRTARAYLLSQRFRLDGTSLQRYCATSKTAEKGTVLSRCFSDECGSDLVAGASCPFPTERALLLAGLCIEGPMEGEDGGRLTPSTCDGFNDAIRFSGHAKYCDDQHDSRGVSHRR